MDNNIPNNFLCSLIMLNSSSRVFTISNIHKTYGGLRGEGEGEGEGEFLGSGGPRNLVYEGHILIEFYGSLVV